MEIGTAIFWLAALTLAFIVYLMRDSRRHKALKTMIEGKK